MQKLETLHKSIQIQLTSALFSMGGVAIVCVATKMSKESIEDWDKAARRASGSTIEMGAFIANRMSEKLRQKYPRQPLMWQRLLDFLSIKRVEIKLIPGNLW